VSKSVAVLQSVLGFAIGASGTITKVTSVHVTESEERMDG